MRRSLRAKDMEGRETLVEATWRPMLVASPPRAPGPGECSPMTPMVALVAASRVPFPMRAVPALTLVDNACFPSAVGTG